MKYKFVKRKKRLRKKLKIYEYTEYGFNVSFEFDSENFLGFNTFLDNFIKFIEDLNRITGGGINNKNGSYYIVIGKKNYSR